MDFAIEVVMSDGTRTKLVDDVVNVFIDKENVVPPIVILEDEYEDGKYHVGLTTISESQRVTNYYPDRVLEYSSFREKVRTMRKRKNRKPGTSELSWFEEFFQKETVTQLEFDFETPE